MHPVFIQAIYYGILMTITIGIIGLFLKGFFFKYLRVRVSFGALVMVKIRSTLRDHFACGFVEDGFLVYKVKKDTVRISIGADDRIFYRCLSINWVDVDEQKNAICKSDYSTVVGFDAKKYSDLLTRALMRPSISTGQEKILMFLIICCIVIGIGCLYLTFQNTDLITQMSNQVNAFSGSLETVKTSLSSMKGTVIGGGGGI